MPSLDRIAITNIETGRRQKISVDELVTLAFVLDVAPIHLLIPIGRTMAELDVKTPDDQRPVLYKVTPERFAYGPGIVRQWVRGAYAFPTSDPRFYYSEVPKEEWEAPEKPAPADLEAYGRTREAVARHLGDLPDGRKRGGES